MSKVSLSVIVPIFNEEKNISRLHKELVGVLSKLKFPCEVIYINDGSRDNSVDVLKKEISSRKAANLKYKVINFGVNFGQTAAVSAGVDHAEGELISFLDADLQNDPRDIPRFLEKIEEGYDAAFGWRKKRHDRTLRRFLSQSANLIVRRLFNYPFHDVGCSARVVRKEFVKGLKLYGELHRILPVLIYFRGPKVAEVIVNHRPRLKGRSSYGYERIVKTAIDLITIKFIKTFGTKPAYVFGSLGFLNLLLGFLTFVTVSYRKLFLGVFVHRDPLFIVAIFLSLLGAQFILMGLIAELQVRTYFESQDKTIYDIKSIEKF